MLERGSDTLIMTGTKDTQPDDETNITLRLQATCVDNRDGSSTVFASAAREVSKLQKVGHSITAGVSVATISVPSGTDRVMRVQKRETIQDPTFYQGFYTLVRNFAREEKNGIEHAVDWRTVVAFSAGATAGSVQAAMPSSFCRSFTAWSRVRVCQRARRPIGSLMTSGTTFIATNTGPGSRRMPSTWMAKLSRLLNA